MTDEKLTRLARSIAREAYRLDDERLDWEPFYEEVDKLLLLDSPVDEVQVLAKVSEELAKHSGGSFSSVLDELEIESEYTVALTKFGRERGVILFAMPFVAQGQENIPCDFKDATDVTDLEDILKEAGLFSEFSELRLIPRVFRPEELLGRTYGEISHMTNYWGEQAVLDGDVDGAGPDCLLNPPIFGAQFGFLSGQSRHVQLRYLVGVVWAPQSYMDGIFTPVPLAEVLPLEGDEPEAKPSFGKLSDGQDWEPAFCKYLGLSLGLLGEPLAALMPEGFASDLRSGLELEREIALSFQVELCSQMCEQAGENLAFEVHALTEPGLEGWDIILRENEQAEDILGACSWPVFVHESSPEAAYKLVQVLNDVGCPVAVESLSGAVPGTTLH